MIFTESKLIGSYIIDIERHEDSRGFFARTFCQNEFTVPGLNTGIVQCNISFNSKKGTLRGMHYQTAPYAEARLVRCTQGAIFDVIVDLRSASPTRFDWIGVELSAGNHKMVYVPEGFAHGFQTLEDNSEVFYQMSAPYRPESAAGVRWNDPKFAIDWPLPVSVISERDSAYPDYRAI